MAAGEGDEAGPRREQGLHTDPRSAPSLSRREAAEHPGPPPFGEPARHQRGDRSGRLPPGQSVAPRSHHCPPAGLEPFNMWTWATSHMGHLDRWDPQSHRLVQAAAASLHTL